MGTFPNLDEEQKRDTQNKRPKVIIKIFKAMTKGRERESRATGIVGVSIGRLGLCCSGDGADARSLEQTRSLARIY